MGVNKRSVLTALTAAAGVCLWLLTAAGPAAATMTCAYDSVNRTVNATADGNGASGGVYRTGDQIAVSVDGPCGAATVFNTDTIVVRDVSLDGSISSSIGTNLAPGFTDEPGSSDEIEIVLDYGPGQDVVSLFPENFATPAGPTFITVGRGLMNLNAAEPDGVDADVTLRGVDSITIFRNASLGGEGNEIRGDGGDGTGAESATANLSASGGPGGDLLVGGTGTDYFSGHEGADRVRGGGGRDSAYGGPGPDRLLGGRGPDRLAGNSGNDHNNGGPGADYCDGGPGRDSFASCEQSRD